MSSWKRGSRSFDILAIFVTGFTLAPATVSILLNNWMLTRNAESQQLKSRYGLPRIPNTKRMDPPRFL
jgi:hypothetical protein